MDSPWLAAAYNYVKMCGSIWVKKFHMTNTYVTLIFDTERDFGYKNFTCQMCHDIWIQNMIFGYINFKYQRVAAFGYTCQMTVGETVLFLINVPRFGARFGVEKLPLEQVWRIF